MVLRVLKLALSLRVLLELTEYDGFQNAIKTRINPVEYQVSFEVKPTDFNFIQAEHL